MNEDENIYQQEIPMDEDDDLMPDGYAEGDDFFSPDSWTGGTDAASATEDVTPETENGSPEETADGEAPAIEQTPEDVPADSGAEPAVPATDTQEQTPSTKRVVRYQFDHEDREEEIDDADLPELLQKARSVDRYRDRLNNAQSVLDRAYRTARALKYDSAEAFLDAILDNAKSAEMDSLRGKGVPDEIAEDYIGRKYGDSASPYPAPAQQAQPQQANPDGRDYSAEARELLTAHPELIGQQLPQEIYAAVQQPGVTFLQAYNDYQRRQTQADAERARSDAEKLRKENRILKNNADSADRAPVSGVSKGGRASDKSQESDPFIRGFDSDDW